MLIVLFYVSSLLVFHKLCIFILNLAVMFLLSMVKICSRESHKNLEYFVTNINKECYFLETLRERSFFHSLKIQWKSVINPSQTYFISFFKNCELSNVIMVLKPPPN